MNEKQHKELIEEIKMLRKSIDRIKKPDLFWISFWLFIIAINI